MENKKVFLIVHSDSEVAKAVSEILSRHYDQCQVYHSSNGSDALLKARNTPPHVIITDLELEKVSGSELIRIVVKEKGFAQTAVVVLSDIPDQEAFIDDVVNGRIQFLAMPAKESQLCECVNKALTFSMNRKEPEFRLKFVGPGQLLFKQGEKAEAAYLVKKGKLRAFVTSGGRAVTLGEVQAGEFVGEMAHINGEPRSADVEALEDCELIEIPLGTLDTLLFTKPAWSKALMRTLSKRLKSANVKKSQG